jgi:acyl-CoA reductase-like NAD-dependent aldehyde dehydrogenase
MEVFKMFIDGASVESGASFDVINPATGKPFAQCQLGSPAYVDQAVAAARKAFASWSKVADEERKQMCRALADKLEANMPELMELVTKETGKPMGGLNSVGSGMEVGGAIAWIQFTAELDVPVEVVQDDDAARIEVRRKPLGVVASITPWNWPLMIAIWHVIPALRTGNTVVIKPSPYTPAATARFVELAGEVLPPGVLNLVTGEGDVGQALTEHSDINKVIFTGSTPTGKQIMRSSAATLKRLTLELGGNDAGIVLPDVNVKEVAPKIFGACFHNNGQTCAALKRLYVHESQYEDMCNELAALANEVVVGDGLDEKTQLGPLQNEAQFQIVQSFAEQARKDGGRFVAGGKAVDRDGYFFEPTIVADLTEGTQLVDEEPFGPIVPVIKYSDLDEVIDRANRNDRGLGGSVWSSDSDKAAELASRLECGSVWVNDHGAIQPNAPFGGVKQSGFGVEFGLAGLLEYTSSQTIKITK